ncbi:MAG: sulfite exporter TauE/SafE family protein [Alcanivorax sp.]|nr:sulfite exporter TauE/SafE family protein [Alcanivorax sp.]
MLHLFLICLGVGVAAGLLAGALGLGGGVVIVPALIFLFKGLGFPVELVAKMAVATSLSTIIVTSISAVRTHHGAGFVRWPLVWQLAAGIVVGAFAGAFIADGMKGALLTRLFGLFAMLVALQMLLAGRRVVAADAPERVPGPLGLGLAGMVIGTGSALFGIGGGSLTVPFLTWCRLKMQQAVAISAACGLPIALSGTVAFALAGWGEHDLPAGAFGYVYLPATAGIVLTSFPMARFSARLSHRLPSATLKKVFALVLFLLGLKLVLG